MSLTPSVARPETPAPVLRALLLCDEIIREEGTGKVSLIGISAQVQSTVFPFYLRQLAVYANITDACGAYVLRLHAVRLDDLHEVADLELPITMRTRMASGDAAFKLADVEFARPGRYEFSLSANGRPLGTTTFNVTAAS